MKGTIIILMICFLSGLITRTEGNNNPVLDYFSHGPIRRLDGCVIKTSDGYVVERMRVERMRDPFSPWLTVSKFKEVQHKRFVRLNGEGAADQNDNVTLSTKYSMGFNDTQLFWNVARSERFFRITEAKEGLISEEISKFTIEETEESRVYRLVFHYGGGTFEVGLEEADFVPGKYYLAALRPRDFEKNPNFPLATVPKRLRFTFQTASMSNLVLDYVTGNPIRRSDGIFIRASTDSDLPGFTVYPAYRTPWLTLESTDLPDRFVRLSGEKAADENDLVTSSNKYRMRFNDTEIFWNIRYGLEPYRIHTDKDGDPIPNESKFRIEKTEESRVYRLFVDMGFLSLEVGLEDDEIEERYYLAAFREQHFHKVPAFPYLTLPKRLRFTFQAAPTH